MNGSAVTANLNMIRLEKFCMRANRICPAFGPVGRRGRETAHGRLKAIQTGAAATQRTRKLSFSPQRKNRKPSHHPTRRPILSSVRKKTRLYPLHPSLSNKHRLNTPHRLPANLQQRKLHRQYHPLNRKRQSRNLSSAH